MNNYETKYKKYKQKYFLLQQKGGTIQWQYDNKNKWIDYDPETNTAINAGYKEQPYGGYFDITVTIKGIGYKINYLNDKDDLGADAYQIKNGTKRRMRKKDVSDTTRYSHSKESTFTPQSSMYSTDRSIFVWFVRIKKDDNCNFEDIVSVISDEIEKLYIRTKENSSDTYHQINDYLILFKVEHFWNEEFHAIQINPDGKSYPLRRQKI